jgi:hypothetical protein
MFVKESYRLMKLNGWLRPNTFTLKSWPRSWDSHGIWLLRFAFALAPLCKCDAIFITLNGFVYVHSPRQFSGVLLLGRHLTKLGL